MSHKRTDIRAALVSLLKGTSPSFNTAAGARVYPNRVHKLDAANLPAIVVYDEQESAIIRDQGARQYLRTLTMKIDLILKATINYDTALDDLAKQVEDLMSANKTLNGTAHAVVYQNTELSYDEAEQTIGRATLTYEIKYLT